MMMLYNHPNAVRLSNGPPSTKIAGAGGCLHHHLIMRPFPPRPRLLLLGLFHSQKAGKGGVAAAAENTNSSIDDDNNNDDDNGRNQRHSEDSSSNLLLVLGRTRALLLEFARSNFLPLALVTGITLGMLNPALGCLAHKYSLSKLSTFSIFFISGLTLRTSDLGAAIGAWPAGIFGLSSILVFTPFLSRFIMQIKYSPHEFITGLALFCCMPTTLSSGVTLTQLAGGNSALALAMTVISNLLGIMIVPLSLSNYVGAGAGVSLPTEQLYRSLINTLLIPLVLGKVVRGASRGVAKFVDRNHRIFQMTSAILLSLVPWMQVSRSRSLLLRIQTNAFAFVVAIGIVLHLALLAFNSIVLQILSQFPHNGKTAFASKEYSRAVILVASQKTLPVLVAVVDQLGGALGESGLLVIPCVAAHINQIIIDSVVVSLWRHRDLKSGNSR